MGDYLPLLLSPTSSTPPSPPPSTSSHTFLTPLLQHYRSRLTTKRTFSEEEISLFARLCGDRNPLHRGRQSGGVSSSSSPSTSASSSNVLVPGLLTASLFPGLIGTAIPGSVYLSQSLRFGSPLQSGEEVAVEVEVVSKKVLPFNRLVSSSAPSSESSSSSFGLLTQVLRIGQQKQERSETSDRGGSGRGRDGETTTTTAVTEEDEIALPNSFVRAKLATRAWKEGGSVVVVEGEAEALWPVY